MVVLVVLCVHPLAGVNCFIIFVSVNRRYGPTFANDDAVLFFVGPAVFRSCGRNVNGRYHAKNLFVKDQFIGGLVPRAVQVLILFRYIRRLLVDLRCDDAIQVVFQGGE